MNQLKVRSTIGEYDKLTLSPKGIANLASNLKARVSQGNILKRELEVYIMYHFKSLATGSIVSA